MTKSMICDKCRYLAHEYYEDVQPQPCGCAQQPRPCPRPEPQRDCACNRPEPQRPCPCNRPEPQRPCPCNRPEPQRPCPCSRPEPQRPCPCNRPAPRPKSCCAAENDVSNTTCDCGQNSCNVIDRQSLMMQITQCEFICIDINLYLDTHPCDERALADYNCYAQQLEALKALYVKHYGPLQNFGNSVAGENWDWIDKPWPWCPRKQLEGK